MILTNGRIHVMDAASSIVEALVVRDGRVAFAGRDGDIAPAVGESTIDLGGRAVFPGFVDAHAHLMSLAKGRLELGVAHLGSEDDAAGLVARAPASTPRDEWITGRGSDQTLWPTARLPTRATLDGA